MTSRPQSLTRALFGRIGFVFIVLVLAVGLLSYVTARDRIDEAYDGQLIIAANVLQALMSDELKEATGRPGEGAELSVDDSPLISAEDRKAFDAFADWRMFRIWQGDRLVMRSDTGPRLDAPFAAPGFSDIVASGYKWRIYTLKLTSAPVTVQVGERMGIRAALVQSISLELLVPLLLLIPAVAFLIWLALNGGLRALRALVGELGRRSVRDLAPLPVTAWPQDLGPLVGSVNQLLARIDQSLQHERRFVDQAAHQLRTPLAVVKLQAQMIARESDPVLRQELIGQLADGVDRASRLIDRLLTLARLDSSAEVGGVADLSAEAVAALTDMAPVAGQAELEMAFEAPVSAFIAGDPILVRLICANLIENAIRHSPPHAEVKVRVQTIQGEHVLHVIDQGPGIPPAERERVVERFNRGEAPQGNGVGLGLSIVTEASRLLSGRLELRDRDDGGRGLDACVILPALPTAKT